MKKKVSRTDTVQLPCEKAKPGPKLASLDLALGPGKKVQIMSPFCREFNEKTKKRQSPGKVINVKIKVFSNGTYQFSDKTPPTIYLIRKRRDDYGSLGGSAEKKAERRKAYEQERKEITWEEIKKIAQIKLPDLNTDDLEKAQKIVAGTAKSAGVKIIDSE
jgi:large subunit ribosomal protein L11